MSVDRRSSTWTRTGLVLARNEEGDGSEVVGDPCIVWDPEVEGWRMVIFYDPPGHASSVSSDPTASPGSWSDPEPLVFTNTDAFLPGYRTHKPFIVLDPHLPNRAAKVDGRYWMVLVDAKGSQGLGLGKHVRRAHAEHLAGPWTLEEHAVLPLGEPGSIDELHVDVVSGYWFEDTQQFVYYYMANNKEPRADQPWNPFGASVAVATQGLQDELATKHGAMIDPPAVDGHWASGYLGGLQILPGTTHRWVGIVNASPTKPSHDGSKTAEEPAPCLGGMLYTDEEVPTRGWVFQSEPVEWVDDIPPEALERGEGVNFWRQHLLVVGDLVRLFYNSGPYGREQMFSKVAHAADVGVRASSPSSGPAVAG